MPKNNDFLEVALRSLKVLVCDARDPWDDIFELNELQTLVCELKISRLQQIQESMDRICDEIERLIRAVEYTKVWSLIAIAEEADPESSLLKSIKLRLFEQAYDQFHKGMLLLQEGKPTAIFLLEQAHLVFPPFEGITEVVAEAERLLKAKKEANQLVRNARSVCLSDTKLSLTLIEEAILISPNHPEALALIKEFNFEPLLNARMLSRELEAGKKAMEEGKYRAATHVFLGIVLSGHSLESSLPLLQEASMLWQKETRRKSIQRVEKEREFT